MSCLPTPVFDGVENAAKAYSHNLDLPFAQFLNNVANFQILKIESVNWC